MHIILIGDVHGCIEELKELTDKIANQYREVKLIFVGDLIDKGPNSAEVLDYVYRIDGMAPNALFRKGHFNVSVLKGNHEIKALRWHAHEAKVRSALAAGSHYRNPMQVKPNLAAEWGSFAPSAVEWLSNLSLRERFAHDGSIPLYAVHAGCIPGRPVERQSPESLTMVRWVDDAGRMVPLQRDAAGNLSMQKPPEVHDWMDRWDQPQHIVYGHAPRMDVQIDKAPSGAVCFGIDTACVFGNYLTALVWEALDDADPGFKVDLQKYSILQVRAHKIYCDDRGGLD